MSLPQHLPNCTASALHRDLNARAAFFAQKHALLHEFIYGSSPSVIFGEDAQRRHGNFHPRSYRAILRNPAWSARLAKAHTAHRRARPRADWPWRELDCAASSDALLMNIFCYPGLLNSARLTACLGVSSSSIPQFGVHPRLPRERGLLDTTELDMELDGLLVEAKLTESGFQSARPALLDRFPGWQDVFDPELLPRSSSGLLLHYQLLRGVLAAHTLEARFCLLCDGRRADLIAAWQSVLFAVRSAGLRCRLVLLTWQELTSLLPRPLQSFLAQKYGIASNEIWTTSASAKPASKSPASASAA